MSHTRLVVFFFVATAVLIVLLTPITVFFSPQLLQQGGLSVDRISGSWLNVKFHGVAWRGHLVGDVSAQPKFEALLSGRFELDVKTEDGPVRAQGRLGRGLFSQFLVRDLDVAADLAVLPVLVQLSGQVTATGVKIEYGRQGCSHASGALKTNALGFGNAGLPWTGPSLAGQLQCTNGVIVLPLMADDGSQQIGATMALKPDGSFDTRVEVRSSAGGLGKLLQGLGFRQEGMAMVLVQTGRWRA